LLPHVCVLSLSHYPDFDLIFKLYHGGRKKIRLCFSLFCFTSKTPICMMVPVFFFFDIYSLIVLQISGLFPGFTSFTAIVYLFLSPLFCDITSVCYRIHLSPFYFSNTLPGVLNLSQCQLPAL